MKEFNCDLHYHGRFAGGVSKNMLIPIIAEQSQLKGLDVVVTSDVTHAPWLKHCKETLVEEEGHWVHEGFQTKFLIGTEVQDPKRVHHLIYLEDFNAAEKLREKLLPHGRLDAIMQGRPWIKRTGEQIAEMVLDLGGLIGPAHSFTPYFGAYAHFDSLKECYGQFADEIKFMELGLSADTNLADQIAENHNYQFLTCSDSHSPWPHRIGREFTRMKMNHVNFTEFKKVFAKKADLISLNAGLNPREGRYHASACKECFQIYPREQAEKLKWKCPKCKKTIAKGVKDRIAELATLPEGQHPSFRPKYFHMLCLAEIIQLTYNIKKIEDPKIQEIWRKFTDAFGNEITALVDAKVSDLKAIDQEVGDNIGSFRNDLVFYHPGGGGEYGKPFICKSKEEKEQKEKDFQNQLKIATSQKNLLEF